MSAESIPPDSQPLATPPESSESTAAGPKSLPELLQALASADAAVRLEAAQELGRLEEGSSQARQALEQVAVQDNDDQVRQAALESLESPAYHQLQLQQSQLTMVDRRFIAHEIEQWQTDGLIPPHLARLLKLRYPLAAPTAKPALPAKPDEPRPTLAQTLLSETTIKVALYLGAFFIIAAAFIMAIIIAPLRLPILGVMTIGFLGAALVLKRRLPQVSFIFFLIFSFLLPIDAGVLLDLLAAPDWVKPPYWMVVAFGVAVVWGIGTLFYSSRFFSVLTLLGINAGMFQLGQWLDQGHHLTLFLIQAGTLLALGGVILLDRWQDRRFALPLFIAGQLQQVAILLISAGGLLVNWLDGDSVVSWLWLFISGTWFLGALFFALSHHYRPFVLLPIAATLALLPAPIFFCGVFASRAESVMPVVWGWATLLALGGEGLNKVPRAGLRLYSLYFIIASGLLYSVAAVGGLSDDVTSGVGYLVGAAIVYLGLNFYRHRWAIWAGALLAATVAYFASFAIPAVADYEFFEGFIALWPTVVLLAINLITRHRFPAQPSWSRPPLILSLLSGGVWLLALASTGYDHPARAAVAAGLFAIFLLVYALIDRRAAVGYGVTISLAISLGFLLLYLEQETWILPFVGLASIYFLSGFGMAQRNLLPDWGRMLRFSGLGLGALAALTAPIQGGVTAILGAALMATYFALEAFRQRNVWLGLPANLLYLVAYFTLLLHLDVEQPQFYSIGAALLGLIMHYLLVRSGSNMGAFVIGLMSQVVLLGTTYVQMMANQSLSFFAVLFFQALAVLVYALVVRSRSLLIGPLIFIVLGVISAAFTVLAGIPVIILIGCTGALLLLLGVVALVMREQLLKVTGKLSGWRA